MNAELEELAEDRSDPVRHHNRATLDDAVEQFDDVGRRDRARVALAPDRDHVAIEDALHVLGSLLARLDVEPDELARQERDRVPIRTARLVGCVTAQSRDFGRARHDAGAPWVDPPIERLAALLSEFVSAGEGDSRMRAEHKPYASTVPVVPIDPGLRAARLDPELQAGAGRICDLVAGGSGTQSVDRGRGQAPSRARPLQSPWSHRGPILLQQAAS